MKKAIGQTVRDLKREVNKKVLKVPSIEQKMLDATSNEAWGPHGTLLAEIANASRNYHEYQMIMSVVWKRINDTGKNWRHVYKALIVLEYLVGHGSERVIDEIREHAYQIQTLSDFQYIDSSGRDQGNNVRRKSQSLVVLVNDKDRIQEVREKAAANRDKYRNTSGGGMYRPGSHGSIGGYDDDRYGGRDEDRNGYGRGRESSRDDDRYGRYGDGDRYSRDDDRYGYKDDDYRGRSRSTDDYQYGTRSRSADHDQDRSYEDDGQYSSSRGNGAKADDQSQDGSSTGRQLERKSSDQSPGAPPSYEEAVSAGRSPTFSERDGEIPSGSAAKSTSPSATGVPSQSANNYTSPPSAASPPPPFSVENESNGFDEFDPRGSFHAAPNAPNAASPVASAAPATTGNADMDLLGGLSESFSTNSLALVPTTAYTTPSEDVQVNASSGSGFAAASPASSFSNQAFDDPFGDGPFRAVPTSSDYPSQQSVSSTPFDATPNLSSEPPQFSDVQSSAAASSQFSTQESSSLDFDVLADILPPTTGLQQNASSETVYAAQNGQPSLETGFPPQSSPTAEQITYPPQQGQGTSPTSFHSQPGQPAMQVGFHPQSGQHVPPPNVHNSQPVPVAGFPSQVGSHTSYTSQPIPQNANFYGSYNQQMASAGPYAPQMSSQFSLGPTAQQNPGNYGSATPTSQMMSNAPLVSQPIASSSTGTLALVPQPAKEKFETKSTVWADTLNRGLVNLNISGPKTNPLADIGVDFDAMNRREKRFEKPTNAPTVSNVSMGKAMGSGSGIGRAGAGALRPAPNSAMGSGMAMGVGGGPGQGMGMAGYPPANQPMGGMGMHPNPNMGMGMGMGMGQAGQMQQRPMGFPPGSNMPQGYNPAMGMGYYGQQPYGGGYR